MAWPESFGRSPVQDPGRGKDRAKARDNARVRDKVRVQDRDRVRDKAPAKGRVRVKAPARGRVRVKALARDRVRGKAPARDRVRGKAPARDRVRDKALARDRVRGKAPARDRDLVAADTIGVRATDVVQVVRDTGLVADRADLAMVQDPVMDLAQVMAPDLAVAAPRTSLDVTRAPATDDEPSRLKCRGPDAVTHRARPVARPILPIQGAVPRPKTGSTASRMSGSSRHASNPRSDEGHRLRVHRGVLQPSAPTLHHQ
ncbi:hypothetical protein CKO27_16685 [Thiocystis violacea]|nr:hypothetical protein [Thiocystis violacea]